jgi:hypothetical protein
MQIKKGSFLGLRSTALVVNKQLLLLEYSTLLYRKTHQHRLTHSDYYVLLTLTERNIVSGVCVFLGAG